MVVFAGVLLAGAASAPAPSAARAAAAAATPHWSAGKLVPGLAAIAAGWAVPFSVSCTGPGDCTAGGEYGPGEPETQSPAVRGERGGRKWGAPRTWRDPGPRRQPVRGRHLGFLRVAGDCAAVGYYLPRQTPDFAFTGQAFVLDQVNGTWQRMRPLAGVTLGGRWRVRPQLGPHGVLRPRHHQRGSCGGPGLPGRRRRQRRGRSTGFVVQARHGAWGAAQPVTGLSRLDGTRPSQVNTVSCTAPGSCAIGGYYTDAKGRRQAFVGTEVKGGWRDALEVPGTGALNVKGSAETDAVDCPVAGNCTAAGDYLTKSGAAELFVIYETAGSWRSATELPGAARLGAAAAFADVACARANCEVGGTMNTKGGGSVGFLVGEVRGGGARPPGAREQF